MFESSKLKIKPKKDQHNFRGITKLLISLKKKKIYIYSFNFLCMWIVTNINKLYHYGNAIIIVYKTRCRKIEAKIKHRRHSLHALYFCSYIYSNEYDAWNRRKKIKQTNSVNVQKVKAIYMPNQKKKRIIIVVCNLKVAVFICMHEKIEINSKFHSR